MILKENVSPMLARGLTLMTLLSCIKWRHLTLASKPKLTQLKADSLQVDGSSHMTGDLDLRVCSHNSNSYQRTRLNLSNPTDCAEC